MSAAPNQSQPSTDERLERVDASIAAQLGKSIALNAALKARVAELEGALRITRLIICNEMIENAVVDTQTMQSLGDMIDTALSHAGPVARDGER